MDVSPFGAAAVQMLLSGAMLIGIGTVLGEWNQLTFTARTSAAMGYLVVFGAIVAYPAYLYALKHLPIATVSLYAYINPIIAVLLGAVLLDEPFTLRVVIASALVLVGVAIVRSRAATRSLRLRALLRPYRRRDPGACATR
jgi:drug/metabolite transporter (DMT)-like permease